MNLRSQFDPFVSTARIDMRHYNWFQSLLRGIVVDLASKFEA
jgi:hypothetical protein